MFELDQSFSHLVRGTATRQEPITEVFESGWGVRGPRVMAEAGGNISGNADLVEAKGALAMVQFETRRQIPIHFSRKHISVE